MSVGSEGDIGIDVDFLERRYAEEKAKRVRGDAVRQYHSLTGKFEDFGRDPNADADFRRDPIVEDTDVLMIGGGFASLLAGGRLREHGIKDLRIVEKGADFGGTWYWNRYPGAACDVESYIYLPLLEETGYMPKEKYSKASEIRDYSRRLAEHFDLYRAGIFQTEVTSATWDQVRQRWHVETDRGDRISARFVLSCTGLLSNPKLPGIPGIETFEGHAFHTSRWDYGYTGGDESGNLTGLSDKTVGIIGTGSTGIQVIPRLAEQCKHLYVFQRTPSSVDPRHNRATDPSWANGLQPGWQKTRRANFTSLTSGGAEEVDMISDGWTDIIRDVASPTGGGGNADGAALKLAQMKKMERTRQRIAQAIDDPETAEALKPYYHYFCKRPCFHDEYLPAFNKPNVTLVDTKGRGVERVTPAGLVVEGKEYPVDCLIFATGFDFMVEYGREAGLELYGIGGQPLSAYWHEGRRTLFGLQTHGFPNFFVIGPIQSGVAVNYVHMADEQTSHVAHIIARCIDEGIGAIQPTKDAEDQWIQKVIASSGPRREFLESCTPGYYNFEGKRDEALTLNDLYGEGPLAYMDLIKTWRNDPSFPGLSVEKRTDGE